MTCGVCNSDACYNPRCSNWEFAPSKDVKKVTPMPHEELAVIRNVVFGLDDRYRVSLRFTVDILSGSADQGIHSMEEIFELIKKSKVTDIQNLNGRTCVVVVENHLVKFKELY